MDERYSIEINIAHNGMDANLKVIPRVEELGEISLSDLIQAVKDAEITYGVNEVVLREIADKRKTNQWVQIASGKSPVHGEDGKVIFRFSTEGARAKLKEDASGRVNIRDMNLIQNVCAGDVLCELADPKPGTPGVNVRGEELVAIEGKPAILPGGNNTEVSQDGGKLLSTIDGMVSWDGSRVNVEPVFMVDRVDASIGNVRFNGSVVVNGEVGDGYEIHAEKDVTLAMSVGRVVIEAGGNVTISGGILGQHKGVITAGGDIRAKFVQDARIEAKGAVIVDDYILNSEVTASGPVLTKASTAWIGGSTVSSECWIYAHTIGIESACIDTTLIVGHNPKLIEERDRLAEEVVEKLKGFIKLQSSLVKLRAIKNGPGLNQQQGQLYEKVLSAVETTRTTLVNLDQTITEIMEKINAAYSGTVYITGIANEGTWIKIGPAVRELSTAKTAIQFSLNDDELVEKAFASTPDIKAYLNDKP